MSTFNIVIIYANNYKESYLFYGTEAQAKESANDWLSDSSVIRSRAYDLKTGAALA